MASYGTDNQLRHLFEHATFQRQEVLELEVLLLFHLAALAPTQSNIP